MPENVKIYGLPPNQKDVPKNNDRWMPLDEFLEKRFSKVLDGVDIEAVQKVRFERNVIRMNHSSTLELIKAYKDKSKSFQEICDHVDTLNSQNMDTLMEIVRVYEEWKQRKGEEVTITEIQNDKTDFEKLLTTLKERYKLFFEYGVDKSEYNKTYRKSQIEMFEEYVEMVDAFENLKKTPKKGTENDRLQ